jgi:hypothetical protein
MVGIANGARAAAPLTGMSTAARASAGIMGVADGVPAYRAIGCVVVRCASSAVTRPPRPAGIATRGPTIGSNVDDGAVALEGADGVLAPSRRSTVRSARAIDGELDAAFAIAISETEGSNAGAVPATGGACPASAGASVSATAAVVVGCVVGVARASSTRDTAARAASIIARVAAGIAPVAAGIAPVAAGVGAGGAAYVEVDGAAVAADDVIVVGM